MPCGMRGFMCSILFLCAGAVNLADIKKPPWMAVCLDRAFGMRTADTVAGTWRMSGKQAS